MALGKTICQQLRDIRGVANKIKNDEIVEMAGNAIEMAKKMDARLRYYKRNYDKYWWKMDIPPDEWRDNG